MRTRLLEELDYTREGAQQRAFAAAYPPGDPEVVVPGVVLATPRVLVQDWLDGVPLARVATTGTQADRDRVGELYQRFLLSGPPGAACCTPTRTPGTSASPPTGGSASSTSVRAWRCPAACRAPSAG